MPLAFNTEFKGFVLFILSLIASFLFSFAPNLQAQSAKSIYKSSCLPCHSLDGKPTEKAKTNFSTLKWQRSKSDVGLVKFLTENEEHFKILESDKSKAEKIVNRYLRTLGEKVEFSIEINPNEIFKKNCSRCHLPTGEPIFPKAKNLQSAELQESLSDDEIFKIIQRGRDKMPDYGAKLTEQEIWSLVDFVRKMRK